MDSLDKFTISSKCDKAFEWAKWGAEIPYIKFPSDWLVKMRPPFTGAIVRFIVSKECLNKDQWVSVYLDCYDLLGHYGEPYWETFPYDEDVGRCAMGDTEELLKMISSELEKMEEQR